MHWISYCLLLLFNRRLSSEMSDNKINGNCNENQPYVVGILSPSTTLYIDQIPDNGNIPAPPTELNLTRRNTNSFQITSVTIQGSRRNEDLAYDSADDLDESHTDDLSSDFLDSSRADNEGYHSEDFVEDIASPCAPIIFTQLPNNIVDRNMNLSIGVTPTYSAVGPVAGGVTMMTSKSESPISAQVPIMNPLPNNWQRRFKVVKIMSSEPFQRGRWICMDFKDPPTEDPGSKLERNGTATPPTIQVTNCDSEGSQDELMKSGNFAQVYEIPINQTFSGNFVVDTQQHMYGIILPQDHPNLQPVTLIQDMSLQTTVLDRNFNNNNLVNNQNMNVQVIAGDPCPVMPYQPHMPLNNGGIPSQSPPATLVHYDKPMDAAAVHNHSCAPGINSVVCDGMSNFRSRTNSESNKMDNPVPGGVVKPSAPAQDSESFSCLDSELSLSSGLLPRYVPSAAVFSVANGCCYSPPPSPKIMVPPLQPPQPLQNVPVQVVPSPPIPVVNGMSACHVVPVVAPQTPPIQVNEVSSSQTALEKIPSDGGQEIDLSTGSAAPTGANTVAIDNKIEQAMDLVKSHLMFAVREEVEVLKEKITELLERISQLEHENDILRANASAETLLQLNNQFQKKPINSGPANKQQPVASVLPSST